MMKESLNGCFCLGTGVVTTGNNFKTVSEGSKLRKCTNFRLKIQNRKTGFRRCENRFRFCQKWAVLPVFRFLPKPVFTPYLTGTTAAMLVSQAEAIVNPQQTWPSLLMDAGLSYSIQHLFYADV